jgi:phosphoglycolate phosphatase
VSSPPTHIVFDLDGTIADSQEGIMNCLRMTLDDVGVHPSDEELRAHIGPPLEETFRDFGIEEANLWPVIDRYRDLYAATGVRETRLYDGVQETLQTLHEIGVRLGLATAKRVDFAKEMLTLLGVDQFFEKVEGVSFDDSLTTKKQVLNLVLDYFQPVDRRWVWMVGDREQDILAALFHGVVPIGVLWGYGSRHELDSSGAKYLIEDPRELLELDIDVENV